VTNKTLCLCASLLALSLPSLAPKAEPVGYPYSGYAALSNTWGSEDEDGYKLDGYGEQGIDWVRLGSSRWLFNTFVGVAGTVSDQKERYWDNKAGPRAGLKLRWEGPAPGSGWSNMAIGVRAENYQYFGDNQPYDSDTRFVLFLEAAVGGDWKKR
jgi:hypothetical protein